MTEPVERILFVTGLSGRTTALEISGPRVEYEYDADHESFDSMVGAELASEPGIWVWEGRPKPTWGGQHAEEYDGLSLAEGAVRDPTEEEWEEIRIGGSPWLRVKSQEIETFGTLEGPDAEAEGCGACRDGSHGIHGDAGDGRPGSDQAPEGDPGHSDTIRAPRAD